MNNLMRTYVKLHTTVYTVQIVPIRYGMWI